jgi:hypothetical protein
MGLDVGKVTIEYLPRPEGLAKAFAWHLASEASCVGDGNAFGFYFRSEMEKEAKEFAQDNVLAEEILKDWLTTLPWDESGYLVLTFNW